ncbi:hypothetical protein WJX77_009880 [Trebouxia sp. C0004]
MPSRLIWMPDSGYNVGCAAYGSQLSQTLALKLVEASLATAMSYLSVVWGMLSGYLVFHEVSNKLSLGGASLMSGTDQEGSSYTTFKPPHKKKLQRHIYLLLSNQSPRDQSLQLDS